MRKGQPSRTAEYVALFRALETAKPKNRRLFEDRFAAPSLGPGLGLIATLARVQWLGNLIRAGIDRRWPGPRTSAVVRTCHIDDAANQALAAGVQQVVLLGAGYDSRAYRLPAFADVNVFEIDHPDTSAAKRRVVSAVLKRPPANVHFIPVDFDSESLPNAMKMAGFNPRQRTLVIWGGVTSYLKAATIDTTLSWVAGLAPESKLIFTYVHQRVFDAPHAFDGTEALFASLAAAGEKWAFGLDPAELRTFLRQRGLILEADIGTTKCRVRYFGREAMGMSGYEFFRIATARVGGS